MKCCSAAEGKAKRQKVTDLDATLTGDQDDFPDGVLASEPDLPMAGRSREEAPVVQEPGKISKGDSVNKKAKARKVSTVQSSYKHCSQGAAFMVMLT